MKPFAWLQHRLDDAGPDVVHAALVALMMLGFAAAILFSK